MATLLRLISILAIVAGVVEADYCTNFYDNTITTYCESGCCGEDLDVCCVTDGDVIDYYYTLTAGAIVGIVIAALIGLALVIAGIVFVVYLVNTNCFTEQGNQGVVFSAGACANRQPVTSVNIGVPNVPMAQPTVTKTQTTYQYPQQTTQVFNGGYGYI